MAIEWRPEFSVGDPELDHEHRVLVELVNRTAGTMLEGSLATETSFGDLLRAIAAHFALEERQMREAQYDQLGEHKADHERLLDQLRDIMDAAGHAPEQTSDHLVTTLEAWFTGHFSTHDARLHRRLGGGAGS